MSKLRAKSRSSTSVQRTTTVSSKSMVSNLNLSVRLTLFFPLNPPLVSLKTEYIYRYLFTTWNWKKIKHMNCAKIKSLFICIWKFLFVYFFFFYSPESNKRISDHRKGLSMKAPYQTPVQRGTIGRRNISLLLLSQTCSARSREIRPITNWCVVCDLDN